MDLLRLSTPRNAGERALRILRFTASDGSTGYGDFFDFGLSAPDLAITLARVVDRYAAQDRANDVFELDPSGRPLGLGHPLLGRSVSSAPPPPSQWWSTGRAGLLAAISAAGAQVAATSLKSALPSPQLVRLCTEIPLGDDTDTQVAAARKVVELGLTAISLQLDDALHSRMVARGEIPPYVYPSSELARIGASVRAIRAAVGDKVDLVLNARGRVAPHGGLARLARVLQPAGLRWIEQPSPVRLLSAQADVRARIPAKLAFGHDFTTSEDFAQGIRARAGDVLTPDFGQLGGTEPLASVLKLAADSQLAAAVRVSGGPFSLLHAARAVGSGAVLWLSAPHIEDWLGSDDTFAALLSLNAGRLIANAAPRINESRFEIVRIATRTSST